MSKYKREDFEIGGNCREGYWIYYKDDMYLHHDGFIHNEARRMYLDKFNAGLYHTKREAECTLTTFLEKQTMGCEKKDQKELFANMVKNCGIGIGDKVKVIAKVPSFHMGWETGWTSDMDQYVGKILTVRYIYDVAGFLCTPGNWHYPPQALELVEKKEEEKVCVPTPKHGDIVVDGCHGRKLLIISDTRAVGGFYAYTDDGEIWCGSIACVDLHYANGYYKKQENIFDKSC